VGGGEIFWYLVRTKKQSFIMSETWEQRKLEQIIDVGSGRDMHVCLKLHCIRQQFSVLSLQQLILQNQRCIFG